MDNQNNSNLNNSNLPASNPDPNYPQNPNPNTSPADQPVPMWTPPAQEPTNSNFNPWSTPPQNQIQPADNQWTPLAPDPRQTPTQLNPAAEEQTQPTDNPWAAAPSGNLPPAPDPWNAPSMAADIPPVTATDPWTAQPATPAPNDPAASFVPATQPEPVQDNTGANDKWQPDPLPATPPFQAAADSTPLPASTPAPWPPMQDNSRSWEQQNGEAALPTPQEQVQTWAPPAAPAPLPSDNQWGGTPAETPATGNENSTQPSWTGLSATDAAPTDLSHLINNNNSAPESAPPQAETLITTPSAGPSNPEVSNLPAEKHKSIPVWIMGLGAGLLLLVIGASAYFILGVGQPAKETTSLPATTVQKNTEVQPLQQQQPAVPQVPPAEEPAASGSADFGSLVGGTENKPATSAADLLRQRQGI